MKDYIVVWECNKFAFHSKLDNECRKLHESKFNGCYHLADLFNQINEFLKTYEKGFFPEVISIREV